MKTRIVMTLILLYFLSQNNAYSSDDVSTHFTIKLKLNPESQHIYVNVNLRLNPDKPLPDTLNFSLHKQFTLLKVTANGVP